MTFQTYSLTRVIDGGHAEFAQSFTTSDDDAINCAHMLAAGFNTMSRNMLSGWVLAVVDTDAGTVQYDGKVERIWRADEQAGKDSRVYEQTFKFEPSVDADTILTLFGSGETPTFTAFGKMTPEPEGSYTPKPDTHPKSKYEHVARSVLEDAYAEMQAVKSIVEEVGGETIPLSSGVREMQYMIESRDEQIAAFHQERINHAEANTAARAELVGHVKGAYSKWSRVDPGRTRSDLKSHLRGMIEVLSKYLVAIGEADADERHAVALRVCGIPEGNYLYDEQ